MVNTKKVSKAGGVSIPVGLRREYGIQPGDALDVEMQEGNVILKPHNPRCVFCLSNEQVITLKGKGICKDCSEQVQEVLNGK